MAMANKKHGCFMAVYFLDVLILITLLVLVLISLIALLVAALL